MTVLGTNIGVLLGGTIIVETIFVVPGIGKLMIDSVIWRDYIVLQTLSLLVGSIYYSVNDLFTNFFLTLCLHICMK